MKKIIILFPEVEFLTCSDPKIIDKYIECIRKRYTSKNYHAFAVNYENSKGFYTLLNKTEINSEIHFYSKEAIKPDFTKIIEKLKIDKSDKIVVCGFHCFDCVYRLANELYKLNKNVIIDSDLTESFPWVVRQKGFNAEKFNPDDKIKIFINELRYGNPETLPANSHKTLYNLYSNPVWGVSKKYLKHLKPNDNEI